MSLPTTSPAAHIPELPTESAVVIRPEFHSRPEIELLALYALAHPTSVRDVT
jgi:hypothetical protein